MSVSVRSTDRDEVMGLVRYRAAKEVAETLSAALFEAGQHLLNMQRVLAREFGSELIEAKRTGESTALATAIIDAAFSQDASDGYIFGECNLKACVENNAESLLAREHEIVLERTRTELVQLVMHLAGTNQAAVGARNDG